MSLISKLFSSLQNTDKNGDIEVRITTSMSGDTPKKAEFSDNDPSLLKDITSSEAVVPKSEALPFSSTCPYCGVVYDKPIKRKKTCPECGGVIYVRTTQELYPSSALTEEQLNHAEFYMAMKNTIYITKKDYKRAEVALQKQWNMPKINTYDVLWSLFNTLELYQRHVDKSYDREQVLREVFRRKRWVDEAAAIYQGNRGHDPASYLQTAHHNEIQEAKMDEYTKGLTVKCYDCCEACKKFDDKTFSLAFLEKTPVLPIKTCTRPFKDGSKFSFCRCMYQNYYEWD